MIVTRAFLIATLCMFATPVFAARVVERIAAVVNDDIILESEVEAIGLPQAEGVDLNTEAGRQKWAGLRKKFLDQLVEGKLLAQQAKELKVTVTEDEIERSIEEVKASQHIDTATLEEALKSQGLSMEGYRKEIRRQLLELKVMNTTVMSRIRVTEDEARAYYNQNERQLAGQQSAHIKELLIALPEDYSPAQIRDKRAQANKVYELAKSGTSFDALVKEYSDDSATKASGGDVGYVDKGAMSSELEEVVSAMDPGDVRGPVRTDKGFVIVQLVERKQSDIRPFDEVKDSIRRLLMEQQSQKARVAFLKELRKKAHIDIRDN